MARDIKLSHTVNRKRAGRAHAPPGDPGPPGGPVTAANYTERAMEFVRAHGGEGFVIRPPSAQWTAWMEYFDAKRVPMKFTRKHGLATVPAEWPHQFESDWVIATPPPDEIRLPPIAETPFTEAQWRAWWNAKPRPFAWEPLPTDPAGKRAELGARLQRLFRAAASPPAS